MALLVAVGLVLGTFPVYGLPTLLCAAAAVLLRLNAAGLQLVNQLSTPLQLALLLPLARIGWRISLAPHAPWPLALFGGRSSHQRMAPGLRTRGRRAVSHPAFRSAPHPAPQRAWKTAAAAPAQTPRPRRQAQPTHRLDAAR